MSSTIPELGRAPKFVLGGGSNLVLTKDVEAVVLKMEIPGIRLLEERVRTPGSSRRGAGVGVA